MSAAVSLSPDRVCTFGCCFAGSGVIGQAYDRILTITAVGFAEAPWGTLGPVTLTYAHVYATSVAGGGASAAELLALARPAWHADAACREHPQGLWFADRDPAPAVAICMACLVREPCLALALADSSLQGVWGGTTEGERRALRRWEEVA